MDAKFFRKNADEDDFAIRIDRNGQWYHQGEPITRTRLAKLFSTVLHYNDQTDEYWLITPHEQGRIEVEDVPYVIVNFEYDDNTLELFTNLGHEIIVGTDHPLTCNPENGLAYVTVHNKAKGRLNRAVRESLIDIALNQNGFNDKDGILYLAVNGTLYPIASDTQ